MPIKEGVKQVIKEKQLRILLENFFFLSRPIPSRSLYPVWTELVLLREE